MLLHRGIHFPVPVGAVCDAEANASVCINGSPRYLRAADLQHDRFPLSTMTHLKCSECHAYQPSIYDYYDQSVSNPLIS
jgi:hypothetical protein